MIGHPFIQPEPSDGPNKCTVCGKLAIDPIHQPICKCPNCDRVIYTTDEANYYPETGEAYCIGCDRKQPAQEGSPNERSDRDDGG